MAGNSHRGTPVKRSFTRLMQTTLSWREQGALLMQHFRVVVRFYIRTHSYSRTLHMQSTYQSWKPDYDASAIHLLDRTESQIEKEEKKVKNARKMPFKSRFTVILQSWHLSNNRSVVFCFYLPNACLNVYLCLSRNSKVAKIGKGDVVLVSKRTYFTEKRFFSPGSLCFIAIGKFLTSEGSVKKWVKEREIRGKFELLGRRQ